MIEPFKISQIRSLVDFEEKGSSNLKKIKITYDYYPCHIAICFQHFPESFPIFYLSY